GAKVAMTIALRSPKLLGALIAVDNAPVDANLHTSFGRYLEGMKEIQDARVTRQVDADHIMRKYEKVYHSPPPGMKPAEPLKLPPMWQALPIRQFLLTNLVREVENNLLVLRIPIKTLASSLGNMGDFPFKDPEEACYKGPTLVIRGTKSHYVADDVLPLIGQFFPKFVLKDIDCGHWVISEDPVAFRQVDFLNDVAGD
ncbi:MAG: hypothetical protein Q9220_007210, partial [cf. Caloplaca sp. 1 TL-2023]